MLIDVDISCYEPEYINRAFHFTETVFKREEWRKIPTNREKFITWCYDNNLTKGMQMRNALNSYGFTKERWFPYAMREIWPYLIFVVRQRLGKI